MVPEIILTEMHCIGKVGLVYPFPAFLPDGFLIDHYMHGDALAEIIHDQPCIDFLHGGSIFPGV